MLNMALEVKESIELLQMIVQGIRWVTDKKVFSLARRHAVLQLKQVKEVCAKSLRVVDFNTYHCPDILFSTTSDQEAIAVFIYLIACLIPNADLMPGIDREHIFSSRREKVKPSLPFGLSTFSIQRNLRSSSRKELQLTSAHILCGAVDYFRDKINLQSLKDKLSSFETAHTFQTPPSVHALNQELESIIHKIRDGNHKNRIHQNSSTNDIDIESCNSLEDVILTIIPHCSQRNANAQVRQVPLTIQSFLSAQALNGARELTWLLRCSRIFDRRVIDLIDAQMFYNPIDDTFLISVKDCNLKLIGPTTSGLAANIAASEIRCAIIRQIIENIRGEDDHHMLDEFNERKAEKWVKLFNSEVSNYYDFVILSGVLWEERPIWDRSPFSCAALLSSYGTTPSRDGSFSISRPAKYVLQLSRVYKIVLDFAPQSMQGGDDESSQSGMDSQEEKLYIIGIGNKIIKHDDEYIFLRRINNAPSHLFRDRVLSQCIKVQTVDPTKFKTEYIEVGRN